MRYWIRFNKSTLGPYTPEQIRRQSALTGDTLVCPEGSQDAADWRRLRDVPELIHEPQGMPPPPPPPPAKPKDRKDLAKLIIRALGGSLKKR